MKDHDGRKGRESREADSLRLTLAPEHRNGAKIKVVGVGGGGSNAVDRMVRAGIKTVSFVGFNTDAQALRGSTAGLRLARRIARRDDLYGESVRPIAAEIDEDRRESVLRIPIRDDRVLSTLDVSRITPHLSRESLRCFSVYGIPASLSHPQPLIQELQELVQRGIVIYA